MELQKGLRTCALRHLECLIEKYTYRGISLVCRASHFERFRLADNRLVRPDTLSRLGSERARVGVQSPVAGTRNGVKITPFSSRLRLPKRPQLFIIQQPQVALHANSEFHTAAERHLPWRIVSQQPGRRLAQVFRPSAQHAHIRRSSEAHVALIPEICPSLGANVGGTRNWWITAGGADAHTGTAAKVTAATQYAGGANREASATVAM